MEPNGVPVLSFGILQDTSICVRMLLSMMVLTSAGTNGLTAPHAPPSDRLPLFWPAVLPLASPSPGHPDVPHPSLAHQPTLPHFVLWLSVPWHQVPLFYGRHFLSWNLAFILVFVIMCLTSWSASDGDCFVLSFSLVSGIK